MTGRSGDGHPLLVVKPVNRAKCGDAKRLAVCWALISPLIPPAKKGSNKRTVNVQAVVNGACTF